MQSWMSYLLCPRWKGWVYLWTDHGWNSWDARKPTRQRARSRPRSSVCRRRTNNAGRFTWNHQASKRSRFLSRPNRDQWSTACTKRLCQETSWSRIKHSVFAIWWHHKGAISCSARCEFTFTKTQSPWTMPWRGPSQHCLSPHACPWSKRSSGWRYHSVCRWKSRYHSMYQFPTCCHYRANWCWKTQRDAYHYPWFELPCRRTNRRTD